jgi:hypothetical protein
MSAAVKHMAEGSYLLHGQVSGVDGHPAFDG